MTKQEKTLFILIVLFFVTLFFSKLRIPNIIITGAIAIYCFSLSSIKEKLKLLKQRRSIQYMLFFFLLVIISMLLSDNRDKGLTYLVLRLPLLVFPISLGLISMRKDFKEKLLLSYACITTLICVLCLGSAIYNYLTSHRNDAVYNDNLTLLIKQQSVYIALLVNFAIYTFLYFILFRSTKYKGWMALAMMFLFGFSYLLGSRINMAVLMVMCLALCLYYIVSERMLLEGLALTFALLIGSFLVFKFQPQMLNRYKELAYSNYNYENKGIESHYNMELTPDQWNGANLRLAAWNCGWELFRENPIVGVGLGDKKDLLIQKYQQKNFYFAIETNKNVHNNYLDILYSMGIIGLVVFLVAWFFSPLVSAINSRDSLAAMMLITLACAWITEIYLDRSFGGIIAGFFVPFLLADKKKKGQP
ncbi:O-antigen ligase family protein [Pontibacter diazotrophicus]|uniref:O-antigen ligase family protein n=1 Tax=Pontibacter diazotrophicus TaxID=1400979 RepID=A0A3D8LHR0_9BACT|nr:O-antigen ligase family protein [Pontibacter diazotrophicus]RDV16432.1 O-antigen ligase family protein [Pontibacter diazotrophicus]